MKLREHETVLRGEKVVLRPMTEGDWDILLKWNSDPEVLYFSEGDDVTSYSLEDIQGMYRGVSQSAFCFVIELDGRPIGECWLQRMNLKRILKRYPGQDCRRIDLMIGEKDLWGRGLGTDVIQTLTGFGFEEEGADHRDRGGEDVRGEVGQREVQQEVEPVVDAGVDETYDREPRRVRDCLPHSSSRGCPTGSSTPPASDTMKGGRPLTS